jgi:hypothetical protein
MPSLTYRFQVADISFLLKRSVVLENFGVSYGKDELVGRLTVQAE